MREIDNKNINSVNYTGIQKAANDSNLPAEMPTAPIEKKEINDLDKVPSASLGRSQITTDTTESDMMFLLKNPEEVAQLNKIFDKYQEEHSYEEASQLLEAYRHEFSAKK